VERVEALEECFGIQLSTEKAGIRGWRTELRGSNDDSQV